MRSTHHCQLQGLLLLSQESKENAEVKDLSSPAEEFANHSEAKSFTRILLFCTDLEMLLQAYTRAGW